MCPPGSESRTNAPGGTSGASLWPFLACGPVTLSLPPGDSTALYTLLPHHFLRSVANPTSTRSRGRASHLKSLWVALRGVSCLPSVTLRLTPQREEKGCVGAPRVCGGGRLNPDCCSIGRWYSGALLASANSALGCKLFYFSFKK